MAQTSSAAREPSMEEILASIRRIIEDSDVTRHPMPAATPSFEVSAEVKEFRRPPLADSLQPVEGIASSKETVQARTETHTKPATQTIPAEVPSPSVQPTASIIAADIADDADESDEGDEAPVFTANIADDEEFSLDAHNDDVQGQRLHSLHNQGETIALETPSVDIKPTLSVGNISSQSNPQSKSQAEKPAHILSQSAEQQVSAAFQDLNHAVQAGSRRSFDEIAGELLQPMLQDWLDKNLPQLVEKLVREEIERVVRGLK